MGRDDGDPTSGRRVSLVWRRGQNGVEPIREEPMRVPDPGHDGDRLRFPAIADSELTCRRGQALGEGVGRTTIEHGVNGLS